MNLEPRKWSQDETYHLISFYRELRVLWDPNNRDYGLKSKRAEAISALAEKFRTSDGEINRKIHNLRCQFRGEVRNYNRRLRNDFKLRNGQPSGTSVSNWQFFDVMKDMMGFTNDKEPIFHSEMYLGESPERALNIQSAELGSTSYGYDLNDLHASRLLSFSPEKQLWPTNQQEKLKKRKLQQNNDAVRTDGHPTNIGLNIQPNDEIQLFGDYVANELRYFRKETQRIAKLRITRVLLEIAETENRAHH